MEETLFTPAAVMELLAGIEELSEYDIGFEYNESSSIDFIIGDSVYSINDDAVEIEVDEQDLSLVTEVNNETLNEFDGDSEIESGLIKEIAKTLTIGGLIRLVKKILF